MSYIYTAKKFASGGMFETKLSALTHAIGQKDTNPALRYLFHDDVFVRQDWLTEPKSSLIDLYANRAAQLREHYDYLILMCSGGSDSVQVLASFHNAGVPLDEVWTTFPTTLAKMVPDDLPDPENNPLGILLEYKHALLPVFEKYKNSYTKFFDIDSTKFIVDFYSRSEWDIMHDFNTFLTYRSYMPVLYYYQMDQLKNAGKRHVGVIYGIDKPKLTVEDGELKFFFSDRIFPFPKTISFEPIQFFWSPDAPQIPIKQSHVIKRAMEKFPDKNILWNEDVIKFIIHPDYDQALFQRKKAFDHDQIITHFFRGTSVEKAVNDLNFAVKLFYEANFPGLQLFRNGRLSVRSQTYSLGKIK